MERINFSSGSPWEPIIGFSRVVKAGNFVYVAGTTALGPGGKIVGGNDLRAQTTQVLKNIEQALQKAGAELRHVVRTRMFVTDISRWEECGRVHGEFFGTIRPVATMVGVDGFVSPEMLIEIEADAVITD